MQNVQKNYVRLSSTDCNACSKPPRSNFLQNFFIDKHLLLRLRKPDFAAIIYFLVGYFYYHTYMGWDLIDCLYFSTTVLTTVGYGDLTPAGDGVLFFTCFYILSALVIIGTAVSQFIDDTISQKIVHAFDSATQKKLHNMHTDLKEKRALLAGQLSSSTGVGIFDEKGLQHQRKMKFFWSFAAYVFWILLGTLYYKLRDNFRDLSETEWIHAFYFATVTLTTVGFGDLVPTNNADKLFCVVFMLIGIPLFANALGTFTMIFWGDSDESDEMKLNLVMGLSQNKLNSMHDFEKELARIGCGNEVDGKINRFEFAMFILVRNNVVSMEVLHDIMRNFDELDKTKSNQISVKDL